MGVAHATGKYGAVDYDSAVKYLQLAVEHGCTRAIAALGVMYFNGHGGSRKESVKFFRDSMKTDDPFGMNCYAVAIYTGLVPDEAAGSSLELFRFASEMNDVSAQNNYGVMLVAGYGQKKDVDRGVKLIEQAALKQNPAAIANLSYMYKRGIGVAADKSKAKAFRRQEGYIHQIYLNLLIKDIMAKRDDEEILSEDV